MNPQTPQGPQYPQATQASSLNPDQSAASLSFATMLSQQMLGSNPGAQQPQDSGAPQDGSQTPQDAPQPTKPTPEAKPSPDQQDPKFAELESKMDVMKAEMEAMMKDEVSSVKDIIIEALKDGQ